MISKILGQRGRMTIPDPLRRKLGWQAGDLLHFSLDSGRVIISRQEEIRRQEAEPAEDKARPAVMVLLIGGGYGG